MNQKRTKKKVGPIIQVPAPTVVPRGPSQQDKKREEEIDRILHSTGMIIDLDELRKLSWFGLSDSKFHHHRVLKSSVEDPSRVLSTQQGYVGREHQPEIEGLPRIGQ